MEPMGLFVALAIGLAMAASAGRKNYLNTKWSRATEHEMFIRDDQLREWVWSLQNIALLTQRRHRGRRTAELKMRSIEHRNWDELYKAKQRTAMHRAQRK